MLAILKIIIITTKLTEIGRVGVEGYVEVCISDVDSLHMGLNSVSKCYGVNIPCIIIPSLRLGAGFPPYLLGTPTLGPEGTVRLPETSRTQTSQAVSSPRPTFC